MSLLKSSAYRTPLLLNGDPEDATVTVENRRLMMLKQIQHEFLAEITICPNTSIQKHMKLTLKENPVDGLLCLRKTLATKSRQMSSKHQRLNSMLSLHHSILDEL